MSGFEVGDRVRVLSGPDEGDHVGDILTIQGHDDHRYPKQEASKRLYYTKPGEQGVYYPDELELVKTKGDKPMGRRTFRQLKTDYRTKKGATWQEQCEDGTQPYELITPEYGLADSGHQIAPVSQRNLIEDNPEWFVEVFKVTPEYMTQAELDSWEAFKKAATPAKRKYTKRTTTKKSK